MTVSADLGTWDFEVTAESVAAFRAATGAPPDERVPPTFTVVASSGMIDRALRDVLRLDPARTVHGEQTYDYIAPVRIGQRLRGSARIVSDTMKKGGSGMMRIVTIAVEYRDAASHALLLRETTVIIEKRGQG
ncbi:MAG: FAS1-like dehydratase domain-containing protein [Paracoccaceae bacterium]